MKTTISAGLIAAAIAISSVTLGAGQPSNAPQAGGEPIKVGILPFGDSTASGNARVGADIGRTMLTEMARSTSLMPRLIGADGSTTADDLNGEKAVAIGRKQHVDFVFMGTVLDAKTEESNKSGWIPSIKGQSANVSLRRMKATVTLQGELFDVASGARIFTGRVTGHESNNSVGGTAYTKFGAWGNQNYRAFLESPLGKALQAAIAEMTQKVAIAKRSTS